MLSHSSAIKFRAYVTAIQKRFPRSWVKRLKICEWYFPSARFVHSITACVIASRSGVFTRCGVRAKCAVPFARDAIVTALWRHLFWNWHELPADVRVALKHEFRARRPSLANTQIAFLIKEISKFKRFLEITSNGIRFREMGNHMCN